MEADDKIPVEVAYALPDRQKIIPLRVVRGTTAMQAVIQSGIADSFPEIDLASNQMGIFGKAITDPDTQILGELDRVEIYRPLLVDPKQARKVRAEKNRQEGSKNAGQSTSSD